MWFQIKNILQYIYSKTWPSNLLYIQQSRIQNPFPTSKWLGFLTVGNYFHKKLHIRCLKRFWICCCPVNHKNDQTTSGKYKPQGNFKASYISVLNHWKIFETTLTTESNEQNQITYLQSQLFHTIQDLLWLTILSLFTIISIWCTYLQAYWNSHKFYLIILSNLQPSFVSMLFFKKERLKISIIQ